MTTPQSFPALPTTFPLLKALLLVQLWGILKPWTVTWEQGLKSFSLLRANPLTGLL